MTTPAASREEIAGWLARAESLAQSDPRAGAREYFAILQRARDCLEAHNALERLGAPEAASRWIRVNCVIDPRDDIYAFFAGYPIACNPIREYLTDGWRTLSELMVLLERAGRPLLGMDRVLEFGAGFGRFTRHLGRALPGRVTASDVLPGAAEFLANELGVEAFASSRSPAEIRFPQRYDLVFVLSMFTHLPPEQWTPWLTTLAAAVKPGGLLVFTVHNEDFAREEGVSLGVDGTHFIPTSESPSVDGSVYGTTFTTRAYVEAAVARALGGPPLAYAERAFWLGQDAVVVELPAASAT